MDPLSNGHSSGPAANPDPVEANRSAHPRRTPGRPEIGLDVTRRAAIAVMCIVGAATAVLLVIVSTS